MSRELRRRIAVTLASFVAARLLLQVPVPFVDWAAWREATHATSQSLGAFPPGSTLGALGLKPYLVASVMASMALILRQRGSVASGPREHHVVLLALVIALVLGFVYAMRLEFRGFVPQPGPLSRCTIALSLAAGAMATVVLARVVSSLGIGNGVVLILGLGLLEDVVTTVLTRTLPDATLPDATSGAQLMAVALPVAWIVVSALIVMSRWDAGASIDARAGARPSLPLRVAGVGIVGVIFAESLFRIPAAVAGFLPPSVAAAGSWRASPRSRGSVASSSSHWRSS